MPPCRCRRARAGARHAYLQVTGRRFEITAAAVPRGTRQRASPLVRKAYPGVVPTAWVVLVSMELLAARSPRAAAFVSPMDAGQTLERGADRRAASRALSPSSRRALTAHSRSRTERTIDTSFRIIPDRAASRSGRSPPFRVWRGSPAARTALGPGRPLRGARDPDHSCRAGSCRCSPYGGRRGKSGLTPVKKLAVALSSSRWRQIAMIAEVWRKADRARNCSRGWSRHSCKIRHVNDARPSLAGT